MRRKYTKEVFSNRIKKIKKNNPNTCIGVDVIVGFPGETDSDFKETYSFLNDLDISYLHVFTYSERINTTAIKFKNTVPIKIRKERSKQLHALSYKKKRKFYESNIGKHETVLFENENNEGMMYGYTSNYIKIKTPFKDELINTFKNVYLDSIDYDGIMKGKIIKS